MTGPIEPEATWCAYLDESESYWKDDPNTYILAAALLESAAREEIRQVLLGLRLPGQRKLHWHEESDTRKAKIAAAIAELDTLHVVVVRNGTEGERSERRRRKCLERLAYELGIRDVQQLVAESRQAKQNAHDMTVFSALRSRQVIRPGMRLDHMTGPSEALLWIPDAVAGAYSDHRCGRPLNFRRLEAAVDLVIIDAEEA